MKFASWKAKLANENFLSRAPEHVVEEQRVRQADAESTRDRLQAENIAAIARCSVTCVIIIVT